jgi:hypothetical protein
MEREMALKPCRECKREISTDARRCPHCGARNPTDPGGTHPFTRVMALLALVALVAMCRQLSSTEDGAPSGPRSAAPTPGAAAPVPSEPIEAHARVAAQLIGQCAHNPSDNRRLGPIVAVGFLGQTGLGQPAPDQRPITVRLDDGTTTRLTYPKYARVRPCR